MTVSIVIPCHNSEETLAQTLDSVRAQTSGDWKIVAINDRSSDSTPEILARFAAEESRMTVIEGPGKGASAARNLALAHIETDFVAFLDSDDLWTPTRLAVFQQMFRDRPDYDVLYSRYGFFTDLPEDGPTVSTVPPKPLQVIDILRENPAGTMSNLAMRRSALDCAGPFREDITHGEDREWLVRVAALDLTIAGIDETLMYYRTTRGGLSTDLEKMYAGWRESVRSAEALNALPSRAKMRSAEAVYLRYLARRALRLDLPPKVAAGYALRGVHRSPGGFFSDGARGPLTLGSALAAMLAPCVMRHALANR